MAKISQTSITLELETLSCDEVGNGIVMLDITVEEARDLMNLLKERFETNTLLEYPSDVRGFKMTPTDSFANPGGNDPLAGTTTLEYPPGVR